METSIHAGPPMGARALARALAERAEAVCRHYLPGGRKAGRYWTVGNVAGARGRSMYVRLAPPGAVGYWRDAATGEQGDLLGLLRLQRGDARTGPAMAEARRFLGLTAARTATAPACEGLGARAEAAERLWRLCRPIEGTRAEAYLRARGIAVGREPALGFHPALYYRDAGGAFSTFPALVARAVDASGAFAGVQRTYLDPAGPAKAPVPDARKAMGRIFGAAVWLGAAHGSTLAVAEGVETALSLVTARPSLRAAAVLSAAGLGAFTVPAGAARVLIAADRDRAGAAAAERLHARCLARGLDAAVVAPERGGDLNDVLRASGPAAVAARLDAATPTVRRTRR